MYSTNAASRLQIIAIITLLWTTSVASSQADHVTWENAEELLRNDDVAIQEQAARFIAINKPEDQPAEKVLRVSKIAIAIDNEDIRRLGLAALCRYSGVYSPRSTRDENGKPVNLPFANDDEFFSLVIEIARNQDLPIGLETSRVLAVQVLGTAFGSRADLPKILGEMYDDEAAPLFQTQVIEAIGFGRIQTEETSEILIDAIQSGDSRVSTRAARVIAITECVEAMPALLNSYALTSDPSVRQAMLAAVRALHDEAVPKLGELRDQRQRLLEQARRTAELIEYIEDPTKYPESVGPHRR